MQRDHDEDAWRAIVENYGERVELDDEPPRRTAAPPDPEPAVGELADLDHREDPAPAEPAELRAARAEEEERFVPPPPPPLPKLPPDRLAAWTGLFGSPTLLLICLVVGINLPSWAGYLLVAAFIGGFAYLVVTMPRGPGDPWDDGARL